MNAHRLACILALIPESFLLFCARIPSSPEQSFIANISYQESSFTGASLSNQTVLLLPILTKNGPDASSSLDPIQIAKILLKVRPDVEPVTRDEFEARYKALHDSVSLTDFYRLLYESDIVALQNCDSVWGQMKTAFCIVSRIKSALKIKGFDNSVKRRMAFETELWRVDSAEAVARFEVQCSSRGEKLSDADFVRAAVQAAFEKLPLFAPANNERDW
jgi:hypothetical protein